MSDKLNGLDKVPAEIRERARESFKIVGEIGMPSPDEMKKLIRRFQVETEGLTSLDILGRSPLAHAFFSHIFREVLSKAPAMAVAGNLPDGADPKGAVAFTAGFYAGVFLCELGMAKVILREPV